MPVHCKGETETTDPVEPYEHQIAVVDVTSSKTVVGQGYSSMVDVTLENKGLHSETFDLTVCANSTTIYEATDVILASRASTIITFAWSTVGFTKGNYDIIATASSVLWETDTADNVHDNCHIQIGKPGDIVLDHVIDIFDLVRVALHFGHTPDDFHLPKTPEYTLCCNADITGNGKVDIIDIVIIALHFGETDL